MWWKISNPSKLFRSHWPEFVLSVLIITYVLIFSYLSIRRHLAFASSYDLANMDQTIWNTMFGKFFSLPTGNGFISRLGLHADLILVLLAPFYLIYNNVITLLVLQTVFIALAAVPAYLLARDVLKSKVKALIVASVFLLSPGVQWTNIYDFHGVAMAMFFLLATFYASFRKKWFFMYLFALLALLTRETLSLAILMLGVYLFIFVKERAKGLIMASVGLIWFLLFVFILIPYFSPTGRYWVWDWFNVSDYARPDSGGLDIGLIFHKLFGPEAIEYYKLLLKPFAFLPLLGLPWFFISVPDLIINLMSSQGQMRSIVFHYDSVSMVGLVMATILGWKIIEIIFIKYKYVGWMVGLLLLAAALRTNYHYSPLPTTPSYWRPMYEVGPDEIAFEKALRSIPPIASMTASSEIRSHVAHRLAIYNLPEKVEEVEYVAILDQNRIVGDYRPKEFETQLIKRLSEDKRFELTFHEGHFYLFHRIGAVTP